jgi:hypothetical protein
MKNNAKQANTEKMATLKNRMSEKKISKSELEGIVGGPITSRGTRTGVQ